MSTPSSVPGTDSVAAADAARRAPGRRQTCDDRFGAALSAELDRRPALDDDPAQAGRNRAAEQHRAQDQAAQHRATHERTAQHRAQDQAAQHRTTQERTEQRRTQDRAAQHRAVQAGAADEWTAGPGSNADGTRTAAEEQTVAVSPINPSAASAGIMAATEPGSSTSAPEPGSAAVPDVTGRARGTRAEAQIGSASGVGALQEAAVPGAPTAPLDHGAVPVEADAPPAEAHDRGSGVATDHGAPGAPTSEATAPDQPNGAAQTPTQGPPLNSAAPQRQPGDHASAAGPGQREASQTNTATAPGPGDPAIAGAGPAQDQASQPNTATAPGREDQAIAGAGPASDRAGQPNTATSRTQPNTATSPTQDRAGQPNTATSPTQDQASQANTAAGPGRDQAVRAAGPALGPAGQPNAAAGDAPSEPAVTWPAASEAPRSAPDGTATHAGTTENPAVTPIPRDAAPGVPDRVLAGVAGPAPTAPATPPAAPAPASTQPAAPPAAQIAMRIVPLRLDADGVHRLTVSLHPADLGPVQVVAEIRNGDVNLQLSGSTDAGTAALRDSLDDLRRELTDSGFGNCSLDLRDGGGEQPRQQYARQPVARTTPAPIVAPEPAPERHAQTGRLDVRA